MWNVPKGHEITVEDVQYNSGISKDYEVAARNYDAFKVFTIFSYLREYDLKSKGVDSSGNITDGELLKELVFKIIH